MWDREGYIAEVERQLGDATIYKDVHFHHILQDVIVVGLYPSIPHDAGLEIFRKVVVNRENKKVSTDDLTKMIKFVLKNNYFEFTGKVKKHGIS